MKKAHDAREVDNSYMTFDEQVNTIIEMAKEIINT